MPFEKRRSTPKCQKHSLDKSDYYCKQCDIPICMQCISSKQLEDHECFVIVKHFQSQKDLVQTDLQELEKYIYGVYKNIESHITAQIADLFKNSKKLTAAIKNHKEKLHKKTDEIIDEVIERLNCEIDEIESVHLSFLQKQESEIMSITYDITQSIADLKELLNSNDLIDISSYKFKNDVLKKLPPKFKVSLLTVIPQKFNKAWFYQTFGYLSVLSIKTEEDGYTIDSSPPDRPLIRIP